MPPRQFPSEPKDDADEEIIQSEFKKLNKVIAIHIHVCITLYFYVYKNNDCYIQIL